MRRFVFPLERVLRFRRLEMERVEARLSELAFHAHGQRHTAEQRRAQAVESGLQLGQQGDLKGADFHVTRHWLNRLEAERGHALETSKKLDQRHGQVLGELIEARRKVKLLELLRERGLGSHQRSVVREMETQASEFHLAKRLRERRDR